MRFMHAAFALSALAVAAHGASAAQIVISEVDPFGSNKNTGYVADWFELTNTSGSSVNIAGWTMADNHAASDTSNPYAGGASISVGNSGSSAALTLAHGVTALAPGQSAIFIEAGASAASSATLIQSWAQAWFGSNVPSNLLVGTYNDTSKANFGLSQTADMVNIFSGSSNSSTLIASVSFGADAAQAPMATFDNTAGLNNATLTQSSALGVNGAFASASGLEVGSPGVSAVPLPDSSLLLMSGLGLMGVLALARRREFLL